MFAAIDVAREAGREVSYDPNLRLKLWPLDARPRDHHRDDPRCAHFLPSLDDVRLLFGLDDAEATSSTGAIAPARRNVVLKLGRRRLRGVRRRRRDGDCRALASHAVDATGAGDCFDGSFLARLAAGDDPVSAARWARPPRR